MQLDAVMEMVAVVLVVVMVLVVVVIVVLAKKNVGQDEEAAEATSYPPGVGKIYSHVDEAASQTMVEADETMVTA